MSADKVERSKAIETRIDEIDRIDSDGISDDKVAALNGEQEKLEAEFETLNDSADYTAEEKARAGVLVSNFHVIFNASAIA